MIYSADLSPFHIIIPENISHPNLEVIRHIADMPQVRREKIRPGKMKTIKIGPDQECTVYAEDDYVTTGSVLLRPSPQSPFSVAYIHEKGLRRIYDESYFRVGPVEFYQDIFPIFRFTRRGLHVAHVVYYK